MLKKILENKYLNLIARLAVGIMFLIASVSKIAEPATFAREIQNYDIVPFMFLNIMALTLPWIELIAGIFLIAGIRIKANAAISIGLYIMFLAAIGIALLKGLNINCGCHTKIMAESVGLPKMLENSGLLLLCFYLYFSPVKGLSLENYIINKSKIISVND